MKTTFATKLLAAALISLTASAAAAQTSPPAPRASTTNTRIDLRGSNQSLPVQTRAIETRNNSGAALLLNGIVPSTVRTRSLPSLDQTRQRGGSNSGGGGTTPVAPASVMDIKAAIHYLPMYIESVLASRQMSGVTQMSKAAWDQQNPRATVNNAFAYYESNESATALHHFNKGVRLTVLENAPCVHQDSQGREVETQGSSNRREKTICLSISEIEKTKIAKSDIGDKIIGLYMHELYEVVGMTHENAVSGQAFIERTFGSRGRNVIGYPRGQELYTLSAEMSRNFEQLELAMAGRSRIESCAALTMFVNQANQASELARRGMERPTSFGVYEKASSLGGSSGYTSETIAAVCSESARPSYESAFHVPRGGRQNFVDGHALRCYVEATSETGFVLRTRTSGEGIATIEECVAENLALQAEFDFIKPIPVPYMRRFDFVQAHRVIRNYLGEMKLLTQAYMDSTAVMSNYVWGS